MSCSLSNLRRRCSFSIRCLFLKRTAKVTTVHVDLNLSSAAGLLKKNVRYKMMVDHLDLTTSKNKCRQNMQNTLCTSEGRITDDILVYFLYSHMREVA